MKIAITGSSGFLAYHVRCQLLKFKDIEVVLTSQQNFENVTVLSQMLDGCDAIFHLAGMNRGVDQEIYDVNIRITNNLIEALRQNKSKAHVVFSSSTHILKETLYGQSKKKCAELLRYWSHESGAQFTEVIIPHIFGEFGRPNYNSAVATFCSQLAQEQNCEIKNDVELELIHAGDVARKFIDIVQAKIFGVCHLSGHKIKVSEVVTLLQHMNAQYRNQIIPQFKNEFELKLFNTLRSYLFPQFYPQKIKLNSDHRGHLLELVKTIHGGQSFISFTLPGKMRGNHYHYSKIERFCVVSGQASIKLRKLLTNDVVEFTVNGDSPCYVDMPTLYTHNITNTGQNELVTVFWSHEIFDPENSDTYAESVQI